MLKVNPAAREALGPAELARAKQEHDNVRSRFETNGRKSMRWLKVSLETEANQAQLTNLYEMIHPLATRMLHGGMFALVLHFDPRTDPHRIDAIQ